MCVILNNNNFNIDNIYFVESVKNNVKNNRFFSRIIYSTDFFSLKNIYLQINLKDMSFKEQYLKTTIYFDESKSNLDYLCFSVSSTNLVYLKRNCLFTFLSI